MLSYRQSGDDLIVSLAGDLDQNVAAQMRGDLDELIAKYRPQRLVLEMRKLDFMDSSGIGMLIGRYKVMQRRGGRMAVRGAKGAVEKVMHLSGLYQIMERLG